MSLWTGTALNGNRISSVFNRMLNTKMIPIVVDRHVMLAIALGKKMEGLEENGLPRFERLKIISGYQQESRLLGSIPTISTVTDGANEVTTATINYSATRVGGAVFDLTHYVDNQAVPSSEWVTIAGNEAKTASWIDDVTEIQQEGFENTIATAMSSTGNQARDVLGGWVYAVDDSATYDTYGTITRSSSGNENYRGLVSANVGQITFPVINAGLIPAYANKGNPNVLLGGNLVYGYCQNLVEGQATIVNPPQLVNFSGEHFAYMGKAFVLDNHTGSGLLGALDPLTWWVVMNDQGYQSEVSEPKQTRFLQSAGLVHLEAWIGMICKNPNRNVKFSGITN